MNIKIILLKNLQKIYSYIKLFRPINFIITLSVIIVAALICNEREYSQIIILLAALSGALTASAGNVINDYFDIEIDKISHPDRPLAQNKISKKEAIAVYSLLVISSLVISLFISLTAFAIVLFTNILLFFYSFKLKRIPLLGNFIVAFLTGLAFVYGGVAVQNPANSVIPALFAFLINFIREIVKDMEDVEGDLQSGVNTFPGKYGFKKSKHIALLLSIILLIMTFHPFVFQYYKIMYFILVMVLVNSILVYAVKSLFKNDSTKNLKKISNILKLDMVLGLIAIYFGK